MARLLPSRRNIRERSLSLKRHHLRRERSDQRPAVTDGWGLIVRCTMSLTEILLLAMGAIIFATAMSSRYRHCIAAHDGSLKARAPGSRWQVCECSRESSARIVSVRLLTVISPPAAAYAATWIDGSAISVELSYQQATAHSGNPE